MKRSKIEAILSPGQDFVFRLMESKQTDQNPPRYVYDMKGIASLSPSEHLFGYTYFSHMIPPYKPESTLILGYGQGTCSELMRKVWGQMKVCGVDEVKSDWGYVEDKMVVGDAYKFVKECSNSFLKRRFDYILIDLFKGGKVPEFVFSPDFSVMLKEILKTNLSLISINVNMEDWKRLTIWNEYGLKFHRHSQVFGNIVSFWGL